MAIQSALNFIHRAMNDEATHQAVNQLGRDATIDQVVELAVALGYEFSKEELRLGFGIDWQLRWRYFESRNS